MDDNNPLDVTSSAFDPLAALYSEDVVIPDTSAPIVDNVEKFIASLNKTTTSGKKSEKNKPIPAAVQRQFTEEQMPIHCPRRQGNNVLTYMERQKKDSFKILENSLESAILQGPSKIQKNSPEPYQTWLNSTSSRESLKSPTRSRKIPKHPSSRVKDSNSNIRSSNINVLTKFDNPKSRY